MGLYYTTAVFLVILVAIDLLFTFALTRRVAEIQSSLSSGQSPLALPSIGEEIEKFSMKTLDGKTFTEHDFSESDLVAFFSAGCAACDVVKDDILRDPPKERFIIVYETPDEYYDDIRESIASLSEHALVITTDPSNAARKAFRIKGFPTLVRHTNGVIVAAGVNLQDVEVNGNRG
jgi:hypothetical protein